MRVVLFHPAMLPPRDYGGTERVVLWLAKGLREEGHEVWVAALAGSQLPQGVRLIPVPADQTNARDILPRLPAGTDVVHFMAPPEKSVWGRLPCAGVLTVHGNGQPGEVFPANSIFLSQDHARRHGAETYIYNGVDPVEYLFEPEQKGETYLFLSKTTWRVKNLSGAIRLCAQAEVPLDVAGGRRPLRFRARALVSPRLAWLGPVSGEAKARALAHAKALVFPVLWPEPFGLVVVEALMSGTPVIASPRGSLAELVPSEVGALLDPDDEIRWIDLLQTRQLPFHADACRKWAMQKFHYRVMAQNYVTAYRRSIAGERLNQQAPTARGWRKG